jgi:hypothetical protein
VNEEREWDAVNAVTKAPNSFYPSRLSANGFIEHHVTGSASYGVFIFCARPVHLDPAITAMAPAKLDKTAVGGLMLQVNF